MAPLSNASLMFLSPLLTESRQKRVGDIHRGRRFHRLRSQRITIFLLIFDLVPRLAPCYLSAVCQVTEIVTSVTTDCATAFLYQWHFMNTRNNHQKIQHTQALSLEENLLLKVSQVRRALDVDILRKTISGIDKSANHFLK